MVRITYVQPEGDRCEIRASNGETVMSTALANAIPGIIGDCGGGLSCATCHVFVDAAWISRLDVKEVDEEDMLEMTAVESDDRSRLSCQLVLDEDLDGLVVHVPEAQE